MQVGILTNLNSRKNRAQQPPAGASSSDPQRPRFCPQCGAPVRSALPLGEQCGTPLVGGG